VFVERAQSTAFKALSTIQPQQEMNEVNYRALVEQGSSNYSGKLALVYTTKHEWSGLELN